MLPSCALAALSLLLFPAQAAVSSPTEMFRRAEEAYQHESYQEAIATYETMRSAGIEDGVLYYNLGNAYFKAGRLGLAVLNYERALKRMPGDDDTRANLAFARELLSDEVDEPPLPLVIGWVVDLYQRIRLNVLAGIVSACFLLGGVATTVLLSERWPGLRNAALGVVGASIVVAAIAGGCLGARVHEEASRVEAIIVTENAYVRSGPGDTSPRLAEIHEGLKVRVLGEREGWLQVSLASGLTGWIEREQIETI
jgi:Bacterial SH3 domain/Tetratricopeptide repeat